MVTKKLLFIIMKTFSCCSDTTNYYLCIEIIFINFFFSKLIRACYDFLTTKKKKK